MMLPLSLKRPRRRRRQSGRWHAKAIILLDVYWNRALAMRAISKTRSCVSYPSERLPLDPKRTCADGSDTGKIHHDWLPANASCRTRWSWNPANTISLGSRLGSRGRCETSVATSSSARTPSPTAGPGLEAFTAPRGDCVHETSPWTATPTQFLGATSREATGVRPTSREYKDKYPDLPAGSVVYRLFNTKVLGGPYELQ